jgi:hypothetical protein
MHCTCLQFPLEGIPCHCMELTVNKTPDPYKAVVDKYKKHNIVAEITVTDSIRMAKIILANLQIDDLHL